MTMILDTHINIVFVFKYSQSQVCSLKKSINRVVKFQEMVSVRQGGALIEVAAILFSDIKPNWN